MHGTATKRSWWPIARRRLVVSTTTASIGLLLASLVELAIKVTDVSVVASYSDEGTVTRYQYPDGSYLEVDSTAVEILPNGDNLGLASASLCLALSIVAVGIAIHASRVGPWEVSSVIQEYLSDVPDGIGSLPVFSSRPAHLLGPCRGSHRHPRSLHSLCRRGRNCLCPPCCLGAVPTRYPAPDPALRGDAAQRHVSSRIREHGRLRPRDVVLLAGWLATPRRRALVCGNMCTRTGRGLGGAAHTVVRGGAVLPLSRGLEWREHIGEDVEGKNG
jgi:hypothetical protein